MPMMWDDLALGPTSMMIDEGEVEARVAEAHSLASLASATSS